jgi:hypothetical protein
MKAVTRRKKFHGWEERREEKSKRGYVILDYLHLD